MCKAYDPRPRPFLNQATFNKLGRGLLDDNTCTYVVVQINANVNIVTHWGQAFLVLGP